MTSWAPFKEDNKSKKWLVTEKNSSNISIWVSKVVSQVAVHIFIFDNYEFVLLMGTG